MKANQLNKGESRRIMYVENKNGETDGYSARIGWVTFSKSGSSVYYRGRELLRSNSVHGNFVDVKNGEEYWVSGVKIRGSNVHWAESVQVHVDEDAKQELRRIRSNL